MKQARHHALQWIRENKAAFLRLTAAALLGALRILPALLVPQRAVLLIPLATFPIIFYFVGYMPRYRVPLDWILLLFAGAEAWHWIRRI